LLHADRQTGMMKLTLAFRNFANTSKNQCCRDLYCLHHQGLCSLTTNPNSGDRAGFINLVFKPTLMQLIAKENLCVFMAYGFRNRALTTSPCKSGYTQTMNHFGKHT
jgi:hypothetical protein